MWIFTISVLVELMSSAEHRRQHTVLVLTQCGATGHETVTSNVNRNNRRDLIPVFSLKKKRRNSFLKINNALDPAACLNKVVQSIDQKTGKFKPSKRTASAAEIDCLTVRLKNASEISFWYWLNIVNWNKVQSSVHVHAKASHAAASYTLWWCSLTLSNTHFLYCLENEIDQKIKQHFKQVSFTNVSGYLLI